MPNAPKTPIRGFRIPDDEYQAAQAAAEYNHESLTAVIRAALRRYVQRTERRQQQERDKK